jgi:hypothetical protein
LKLNSSDKNRKWQFPTLEDGSLRIVSIPPLGGVAKEIPTNVAYWVRILVKAVLRLAIRAKLMLSCQKELETRMYPLGSTSQLAVDPEHRI